jgi:hypothetical protein
MIPSSITNALNSLKDQAANAQPLANASNATIAALQLNAADLVDAIQTQLVTGGGILDTWVAPNDPVSMINGVLNDLVVAQDQSTLSLMRGVVGRAASNLEQL